MSRIPEWQQTSPGTKTCPFGEGLAKGGAVEAWGVVAEYDPFHNREIALDLYCSRQVQTIAEPELSVVSVLDVLSANRKLHSANHNFRFAGQPPRTMR